MRRRNQYYVNATMRYLHQNYPVGVQVVDTAVAKGSSITCARNMSLVYGRGEDGVNMEMQKVVKQRTVIL